MKHLSFAILAAALGAFPVAAATENPFVDVVPYVGRKRLDRSLVTRTELIREKLMSGDRNYVFVAMHRGD